MAVTTQAGQELFQARGGVQIQLTLQLHAAAGTVVGAHNIDTRQLAGIGADRLTHPQALPGSRETRLARARSTAADHRSPGISV